MMKKTQIMGILNVTPDSFYDGGRYNSLDEAVRQGIKLWHQGADYIDIGGESTRPGALPLSLEEEIHRVIPVIQQLSKEIPLPLSIDTTKPEVAQLAVQAGASLINDITGFSNPVMRQIAAENSVDICVMHMQKNPQTMQENPVYEEGIIPYLINWFNERIELIVKSGVKKERIILDPGIGFGKTVAHNLEIIQNLRRITSMGYRVLLGASRKSFMSKILSKKADELLSPTLAINTMGVMAGVDIIRVHDVQEHKDALTVLQQVG
jgi:dihydropteroate synthase